MDNTKPLPDKVYIIRNSRGFLDIYESMDDIEFKGVKEQEFGEYELKDIRAMRIDLV